MLLAACALVGGCIGMPMPLAPGIGGSVGLPHAGVLTDGAALPQKGEGYARLRGDSIRWGNPRLVAAIERAASLVARERPGGSPLLVGDLSAEHGGQIPNHRSHRTGRDADLLLYSLAPDGRSVDSPGFVRFGRDGLAQSKPGSSRHLRIDVERSWLLVRALAADPEAQAQWLFVARWVEAQLVEYALARGEDDALIARAAQLLRQPSDSFAHDDHFHLRIGCTADEEVAGCAGGGHRWPWFDAPHRLVVSDEQLLAELLAEGAEDPPLTGKAEGRAR